MKYQLLIIFFLGLLMGTAAAGAGAADISGTWAFSVNLEGGPQNVSLTFIFKQEGEKLTGSQSGGLGEGKVTGTVKGDTVAFSVEARNRNGESTKIVYSGALESPTKMTGSLDFFKGPGKWTATKK